MLPLELRVAPEMKRLGFLKKARTWRRTTSEAVQVLNLQKSTWGPAPLYVNLGVYLRRLGSDPSPSENVCHVRARLEQIASPEYWNAICALAADGPPAEEAVTALLKEGIAWLGSVSSKGGLRDFLASPKARRVFIHRLVNEADSPYVTSGAENPLVGSYADGTGRQQPRAQAA